MAATTQPHDDDLITVCDKCHCASCWQGVFMCEESRDAGIQIMEDNTMRLLLSPREVGGLAGQKSLTINNPPEASEDWHLLLGCELCGGDTALQLGSTLIATRTSITEITLIGEWKSACLLWHKEREAAN